ncbi:MAG: TIGR04283 family arsenosugar biosynthesis glycosyltransferase [Acidobacteria bacterium]|nr:TIGR04283 family arsenosugar biosynthesis glycosyltransferase [Acidobacteriota bacterium]
MDDRGIKLSPEEQPPALSIIIPTFNEAPVINQTLDAVMSIRGPVEVIVVDGGSFDETVEMVRGRGVMLITSERGRGLQMHAGARAARGCALWFLHADTYPSPESAGRIIEALRDPKVVAGNFGVRFDGTRRAARFLTWLYPQLRKLGLAYGDSAIFVRREAYEQVGGFQPFPIFEDLDLVRCLRKSGRLIHLPEIVVTSSRRFEGRSFALTFARWSFLQLLYWLGVHPRTLGRLYAPIRGAGKKVKHNDGSSEACSEVVQVSVESCES